MENCIQIFNDSNSKINKELIQSMQNLIIIQPNSAMAKLHIALLIYFRACKTPKPDITSFFFFFFLFLVQNRRCFTPKEIARKKKRTSQVLSYIKGTNNMFKLIGTIHQISTTIIIPTPPAIFWQQRKQQGYFGSREKQQGCMQVISSRWAISHASS